MMNKNLMIVLIFTAFLFACESTPEKADDAVVIEDQGTNLSDVPDTDDSEVQAYGTGDDELSGMSSLDNPTSLLSVKIIYFEYDSSDVKQEDRTTVEAHAAFLVANLDVIITLEGHADERGSREYNLALGERRAETVKRQMTLIGASPDQIRTVSYGEERPAIDEHDDYSWSQNRRVEIIY
ncbi:MAG: peptidoglycan-associated lipoprotein Pal [Gammaproteobacteria bacterium]|nr:MAG: peptidoglycan-associated lipoprotein Pal [Gammaproteobacteria bacterium]RKZ72036.1 MAG: peptidoglycan-associated lipoprotein Pal [Gammaproteobacteria bacterium]